MDILVETKNICKYFWEKKRIVKAVDNVSLQIARGKSMALIGESGSGKTTLGKLIAHLERPASGKVLYRDQEIQDWSEKKMRALRRQMQVIFQSSNGVFDPTYSIGHCISEVLFNYEKLSAREADERVCDALLKTGLDPELRKRRVSQLSGGQCQRANIARALILHPEFVICDEPVSSLDYSIRKQILNLLGSLRDTEGVTYLLITHNLNDMPYLCDEIAVMYQGRIVESMPCTGDLEHQILHPYTKMLYQSIPVSRPELRKAGQCAALLRSNSARDGGEGCPFRAMCRYAQPICQQENPELRQAEPGHMVACHCFSA